MTVQLTATKCLYACSNSGYTPYGDAGSAPEPTEAGLAMLEDQIRDALRARRSVYEDSKTMLLKMFKCVGGQAVGRRCRGPCSS